jgi:uncharacterized OB-fold protein
MNENDTKNDTKNGCEHNQELDTVYARCENGTVYYYALWNCPECGAYEEHKIGLGDFFYWSIKGYDNA